MRTRLANELPFYSILFPIYRNGGYAVQMFWTISGFIFFWRYAGRINDKTMKHYEYFILRFSRLYPLHIVTLVAVAALQLAYFRLHDDVFYLRTLMTSHTLLHI